MVFPTLPIFVLIPAGGSGARFGGPVKKQFLKIGGQSLLDLTIRKFLDVPEVTRVIAALPKDELENQKKMFAHEKLECVIAGSCRAESVKNAFLALGEQNSQSVVLVHDAVRPLVSDTLIRRVIDSVMNQATALPVVPVSDTIKMVSEKVVQRTVNREHLFAAQTPQGARFELFEHAYQFGPQDLTEVTDEAMLMESVGCPVNVVDGERENIKVTTKLDLLMVEAILKIGEDQ